MCLLSASYNIKIAYCSCCPIFGTVAAVSYTNSKFVLIVSGYCAPLDLECLQKVPAI